VPFEAHPLIASYIAVSIVVEQNSDQMNAILRRGGQFLTAEQKASIAANGHCARWNESKSP